MQDKRDEKDRRTIRGRDTTTASSAVQQYNAFMVLIIIFAFFMLGLIFTNIIYNAASDERLDQMNRAGSTITEFYGQIPGDIEEINHDEISQYLAVAAETSSSYIWVYKSTGRMLYASGVPEDALASLRVRGDGNVYLPNDIINLDIPEAGASFTGGNFYGLFQNTSTNWLTIVRPIVNSEGELQANLMIHREQELVTDNTRYILAGVIAVVLVSLLVFIMISGVYSKRIQEPLESLSKAANQVAQGDFSARVDISPLRGASNITDEDNDIIVLARTFNRMIEQVEHSNSEQADFIASISHDLRTPLTTIKGFVSAVLDGTIPPEKQDHYLQIVQTETERLSDLVSDMNEVMQLDNFEESLEFNEFSINDVITRTINGTELLLEEKNITIQTNISRTGRASKVYGDEKQIERVVYNLVTNAIKFVPENDGVIYISARPQGKDILIVTVEDNGPGIADAKLPHIFDRFYKVDHSRTGNSGGSGLGLYICKRILQKHGQQIFASRSESMGGAKFEFTLPLIS